MNLPDKFKFVTNVSEDMVYCAEKLKEGFFRVSWKVDHGGTDFYDYTAEYLGNIFASGVWTIIEDQPTLLQKLKQLTIDTTTNIFIVDGKYEVFYDAFSDPAKASSDEELEKIVDAILTLNKAVSGDDENA